MNRRPYLLAFSLFGVKGSIISVTRRPDRIFRGDSLDVSDSSAEPGRGTRILGVFVHNRIQFLRRDQGGRLKDAGDLAPLTAEFTMEMLRERTGDNKLDSCEPGCGIAFQIEFLETCTWSGTLLGNGYALAHVTPGNEHDRPPFCPCHGAATHPKEIPGLRCEDLPHCRAAP